MNKIEAAEWLQEHNCHVGEYDGKDFVIVQVQRNNPVGDPLFEEALTALGVDEDSQDYHWGYSDEYINCNVCYTIIRTSPTHACWSPDFWVNLNEGEVLCNKCTKENADAYFEWLAEETVKDRSISCVLNPEEHGFTKVIDDLEYGWHPGQNDDPKKLIAWANENKLEIAFDVRQNPFTATFDVWLRGRFVDEEDSIGDSTEENVRTEVNVEQIRKILLVSDSRYSHLRSQFREWPTPEEQMKAALKRESKGG